MTPSPEFFQHLFEYTRWADLRQLETTTPLADEAYFKNHGWSFGTIHEVMLHMLSAQSIWLDRIVGRTPVWLADDSRMAERAAVEPEWHAIHQRFTAFLADQTPQSLAAAITHTNMRGQTFTLPLWNLLTHVCNHSTHHRGQLNSMIKLSGGEPSEIDYSIYIKIAKGLL